MQMTKRQERATPEFIEYMKQYAEDSYEISHSEALAMSDAERADCIGTIETLRGIVRSFGILDITDARNCKKIIALLKWR